MSAAVPGVRRTACAWAGFVALLALATVPLATAQPAPGAGEEIGYVEGRILEILEVDTFQGRALVRLDDGRVLEAALPATDPYGPDDLPSFADGDRVELYFAPGPDGTRSYVVADWVRRPALIALVALFLIASVAVAGFKGLRAFLSTAASLAIVIGFVVPRIVDGHDPIVTSLLGVGGILVLAIWFVHGVSWSTTAALIGTFFAAVLTMTLGVAFTDLARLTGYGSEDAMLISAAAPQVALRGLMLAGLMIGALGALTDITIVQAAVIRELAHVDPGAPVRKLYVHGMGVGRDHVGSLVNTLVLAYTGAALPLLVLLSHGDFGLARSLNLELIAAEVVHTLVGSIGLILAVPVTTLLAAVLFRGDRLPLAPGELDHAHPH